MVQDVGIEPLFHIPNVECNHYTSSWVFLLFEDGSRKPPPMQEFALVLPEGVEPSILSALGLKPSVYAIPPREHMELADGLEPPTC